MISLDKQKKEYEKKYHELPLIEYYKYGIGISTSLKDISFDTLAHEHSSFAFHTDTADGIDILSIEEILQDKKRSEEAFSFLRTYPKDKLLYLHLSKLNSTVVVMISPNTKIDRPFNINTDLIRGSLFQHIIIIAGEHSQATIIDTSTSREPTIFSKTVEIIGLEGSTIEYIDMQQLFSKTYGFTKIFGRVQKNASLDLKSFSFGSSLYKTELKNELLEEGSKGTINAVFLGNQHQQFDIATDSIHKAHNTTSDIKVKGILLDHSKAICRGLVVICPNSKSCVGYQKIDALLLSKDAEISSIPNLEINNNEVQCSHGASIGMISEEALFYAMSRGLSENEAKKLIAKGFINSITQSEYLQEKIESIIDSKLDGVLHE